MKKEVLEQLIGAIILLTALWIGSYFAGTLPNGHWAIFPTILTCTAIGFVGLIMIMKRIVDET